MSKRVTRSMSRETTPARSEAGGYLPSTNVRNRRGRGSMTPFVREPSIRDESTFTDRAGPRPRQPGPSPMPTAASGSGARFGMSSNAYGTGGKVTSSRVASRLSQGFGNAFEDELAEQEEDEDEEEATEAQNDETNDEPNDETNGPSLIEERRASSISASPTMNRFNQKSFSQGREDGIAYNKKGVALNTDEQVVDRFDQARAFARSMPPPPPIKSVFREPTRQYPGFFERTATRVSSIIDWLNFHKRFFLSWFVLLVVLPTLLYALYHGAIHAASALSSPATLLGTATTTTTRTVVATAWTTETAATDPQVLQTLRLLQHRVASLERDRHRLNHESIPFNHVSASNGATVLPEHTSPSKGGEVPSSLRFFSKLWTPPTLKYPIAALQSWSEPGECWCTPASKAALGIRAAYAFRASGITIDHISPRALEGSGFDVSTAPRTVEVWALALPGSIGAGVKGECVTTPPASRGWTCLGRVSTSSRNADLNKPFLTARWTAGASWPDGLGRGTEPGIPGVTDETDTMDFSIRGVLAKKFVVKIDKNWGNEVATCLYRVRLHGVREAPGATLEVVEDAEGGIDIDISDL